MKTAQREHPNRWAKVPSNRAPGAVGLNRSCSIYRAAKQEKLQLLERCFFLTSTFIELIGSEPVRKTDNSVFFMAGLRHASQQLKRVAGVVTGLSGFALLWIVADRHSASVWLRPEPLQHAHPSFV